MLAGMPSISLTDVARMRLENISFFLAIFFLSAFFIKLLWNYLGKDFAFLPRLTYCKALGVTALWGLLFVLVLTMISGARELMTPGAWDKDGATYKLKKDGKPGSAVPETSLEEQRQKKLTDLRKALWEYAQKHQNAFPPDRESSGISTALWELADAPGMRYLYVGGQQADKGAVPLVYEPGLYGSERLVLLTNGQVERMTVDRIQALLPGKP